MPYDGLVTQGATNASHALPQAGQNLDRDRQKLGAAPPVGSAAVSDVGFPKSSVLAGRTNHRDADRRPRRSARRRGGGARFASLCRLSMSALAGHVQVVFCECAGTEGAAMAVGMVTSLLMSVGLILTNPRDGGDNDEAGGPALAPRSWTRATPRRWQSWSWMQSRSGGGSRADAAATPAPASLENQLPVLEPLPAGTRFPSGPGPNRPTTPRYSWVCAILTATGEDVLDRLHRAAGLAPPPMNWERKPASAKA